MKREDIDFESDSNQTDEDSLKKITDLAAKLIELQARVADFEARLNEGKKLVKNLKENLIPAAMQQAGIAELKLSTGQTLKTKQIISGSLPSQGAINKAIGEEKQELIDRHNAGIKWLRDHGHEAIIKKLLEINMGKTDDKIVYDLIETLEDHGFSENDITLGENVHHQTLNSLLREVFEKGEEIPFDIFNIYTGDQAVISN